MREEELSSLYGELDVLPLGIFLLHKLMFMLWICINHLESEKSVTRMGFLSVLLLFVWCSKEWSLHSCKFKLRVTQGVWFMALLLFRVPVCKFWTSTKWRLTYFTCTNIDCIGCLVKERVWESPGSRNGLYVNLCCTSAPGKWCRKLCSEPVSPGPWQNLTGEKGRTIPKQKCLLAAWMMGITSGPWQAVFLEFSTLLYLCAWNLKARDLLISAVASSPACFWRKQLEIQPWHMVIKGQGRAGSAVVCTACRDSSGEAHVCNAEEHRLGILANLLFQCFCKWSVKSAVPAVSGLVQGGLAGASLSRVAHLGFLKLPLWPGQMVRNKVLMTVPSKGRDDWIQTHAFQTFCLPLFMINASISSGVHVFSHRSFQYDGCFYLFLVFMLVRQVPSPCISHMLNRISLLIVGQTLPRSGCSCSLL